MKDDRASPLKCFEKAKNNVHFSLHDVFVHKIVINSTFVTILFQEDDLSPECHHVSNTLKLEL